jgi:hypothetical protein
MPSRSTGRLRFAATLGVGLSLTLATPGSLSAQPAKPAAAPAKPTGKPAAKPDAKPAAPTPLAESLTGMARAEYEAGKILFQARDFSNAIIKFEKAYEISSDPRLLWNVAVCQKELRRYTKMLVTIKKLLADGGPLLTEQDRQDAADIVKTVEAFVSPLKLTVNEPGAVVFIDEEKIGTTPIAEPVMVDVGTRKIRIVKPGFKEYAEPLVVQGGGDVALAVRLEREIHRGQLLVNAGKDAMIYIDGKAVGRGRFEGSVPSGGHTLRVTAPGMVAHQSEVLIQDNKTRKIDVTLNAVPGDSSKWLWIAGGAVLLVGAAVGGAFLFKPTSDHVVGTIDPGTVTLIQRLGGVE